MDSSPAGVLLSGHPLGSKISVGMNEGRPPARAARPTSPLVIQTPDANAGRIHRGSLSQPEAYLIPDQKTPVADRDESRAAIGDSQGAPAPLSPVATPAGSRELPAKGSLRWGLQVGSMIPVSHDLKLTTGSGLNLGLGAHADWLFRQDQILRARIDFECFGEGRQLSDMPGLHQEMRTTVKNESLGMEYIYHPPWQGGRWSAGAGICLIRWTVDSSNRLETSDGLFTPSGTSTWTREGLSLHAGYRLNPQAEIELRMVNSHYGYENQPTSVIALNLLWHF
jgi:hypothetical protein